MTPSPERRNYRTQYIRISRRPTSSCIVLCFSLCDIPGCNLTACPWDAPAPQLRLLCHHCLVVEPRRRHFWANFLDFRPFDSRFCPLLRFDSRLCSLSFGFLRFESRLWAPWSPIRWTLKFC